MTARLPILDGNEWSRVLAFARDLNIPGSETQTDTAFGIRLGNVLKAAGWTQFLSTDFDRACTVIREHYAAKLTAPPAMTEEEAFHEGEKLVWYSAAVLIQMARKAHEHRHNDAALRGLSKSYGRSAKKMSDAVTWFGEWFEEANPRAQTPQECLILFAIAGLPKAQANEAYIYWCDHSADMNYYQALEYVDEIKAQTRLKDFDKFPHYKREVKRGAAGMRKTGSADKQPAIEKIEAILEKEL